MKVKEKRIIGRVLYIFALTCFTGALMTIGNILGTDASYPVPMEPGKTADSETEDIPSPSVAMPDDAYTPVRLTFGGSCTAGSMLGSDSYGTFNALLSENGSSYFLESLEPLFAADDLTMAGCDVVFSDNEELTPAEGRGEWYRGSAEAARIFADGGVDVLSLHSYHPWDYGSAGYDDTKAALEDAGLLWGDHGKAVYCEQAGISVAIYCRYVDEAADADNILAWLAGAGEHDYVALYLTTPETDSDLPDESRQAMFRSFAEAGADLIAATDTARIQPCERWGDSMILYSTGALLDGRTKYPAPYTLLCGVEMQVIDGEIRNVEYTLTPCRTYDDDHAWHPQVLEDGEEYAAVMEFLEGNRETPYMN
ncbi:MAG: hypothetical protein E7579_10175 [Ruminococcaceae bacterium]|nr:hypothetical protein [Oscillospiraceae bacterium]